MYIRKRCFVGEFLKRKKSFSVSIKIIKYIIIKRENKTYIY
jgi:hypothetical protein